jgi:hypothetical protein
MLNGAENNALGLPLSANAIHDTILQLADVGYVEHGEISHYGGGGMCFTGLRVTGRGLQVLGEWPRFVSPASLAALVDRLADYATSEDAAKMSRAANIVRRATRAGVMDIALGLGKTWARQRLGLPPGF